MPNPVKRRFLSTSGGKKGGSREAIIKIPPGGINMFAWLQTWIHTVVYEYIDNERGQDVILWLIVILVLWLIFSGRSVVVQ
jgi:hypothetical protein